MLDICNLSAGYGYLDVIHNISFRIEKGELVALLGGNGAGKTTTLKAITGLVKPSSGEINIDGHRISGIPQNKIAYYGIVMVPEGRRLFPYMSLLENLKMGAYIKRAREVYKDTLQSVFTLFPWMKERQNQLAVTLSGGEQQMLAMARALMAKPSVLLLDEPSTGVAPMLVEKIFKTVKEINNQGVDVLIVEQNAVQTLEIANRAYVMENGSIILEGNSDALKQNNLVKQAYLGIA